MSQEKERTAVPWFSPGRYRVSPVNYVEDVRQLFRFSSRLVFHDQTIHKMDMAAGARIYSSSEKLELARLLDDVGSPGSGTLPWFV